MDVTSLYAYADPSHVRDRELWRGFLSSILPLILPQSSEIIDQMIIESLVDSVEDLAVKGDFSSMKNHPIHLISTHIAQAIGVSQEFALASFYDCEYSGQMPTKLYKLHAKPIKKKTIIAQEETMIAVWLASFYKIRTDKQFIMAVEAWKDWLK